MSIREGLDCRLVMKTTSRIVTAIPVLFLSFDALMKLANNHHVAEASVQLGLPPNLAIPLGVVLATCLVLYLLPRTAPLGAVLLTGYLGGAVLAHLRVGDPMLSHTLFPVYVGAMMWTGLYLRDHRVRQLLTTH